MILARALKAYFCQSIVDAIVEIIVVDDASTDGTEITVAECATDSPVPIRYFRQESCGPATARNLGIKEARGDIILLTDDDIIPTPNLVAEHIAWHDQHSGEPIAVLGHVEWAPEVHPTPFMEWLGKDGVYFHYAKLAKSGLPDFRNFYSCNLSLGADFLKCNGIFDEDFHYAAWEDIELGYRLQKQGLKILYNPRAIGLHYRFVSFADARRRAQMAALAYKTFKSKEAGIYLEELQDKMRQMEGWGKRTLKFLTYKLTPLTSPMLYVLDSRIPLPWPIYRVLYRYHVEMKTQQKLQSQLGMDWDGEKSVLAGKKK